MVNVLKLFWSNIMLGMKHIPVLIYWRVYIKFGSKHSHFAARPLDGTVHDGVIKWKHFPPHWPFVRGHRWFPLTKASGAQPWCFFDLRLNKRLSKQSWGWWFDTPLRSLWHCNAWLIFVDMYIRDQLLKCQTDVSIVSLQWLHNYCDGV